MSGITAIAYLLAGVLFIRSLGGLSKQETAARGNLYGMLGMALAVGVAGVTWLLRDERTEGMGADIVKVAEDRDLGQRGVGEVVNSRGE